MIIQNLILETEEKRLAKLFTNKHITFTVFKGLSLLKQLTNDYLSFKPVGDIDVLVKKKDIKMTLKLLHDLGYRLMHPPKTFYHEYQFSHPHHTAVVEVHTTAFNFDRSKLLDTIFFPLTETTMASITNDIIKKPFTRNDPNYVLVLIIHFALHHCFCGINRLKTLALMLDGYSKKDWKQLVEVINKYKLTIYFSIILNLIAVHEHKRYATHNTYMTLSISSRLYKYLFFIIFSPAVVYHTIDTPNPVSKRETFTYVKSLQIIKILCAEQSLTAKGAHIIQAILLSLKNRGYHENKK